MDSEAEKKYPCGRKVGTEGRRRMVREYDDYKQRRVLVVLLLRVTTTNNNNVVVIKIK